MAQSTAPQRDNNNNNNPATITASPAAKASVKPHLHGIAPTPGIQNQRLLQYLKVTQFDCCRCVADSQPVYSENDQFTTQLPNATCAQCHKPPCSQCTYRSSMIEPVKATRLINIDLEYQFETVYGFICCNCGRIERVVPDPLKHKFASITSAISRDANIGKTEHLQVNFQSQKCGSCGSKCCYECFCFMERDAIEDVETKGTGEPLKRADTNFSTMSKMSNIARSISAKVKAKVENTASRVGSFLSRKNSITGNKYLRLTETQTRNVDFLATEFSERQADVHNPAVQEESAVREVAASQTTEFMDQIDNIFRDF